MSPAVLLRVISEDALADVRAGLIYRAVLPLAPSHHPSVGSVRGGK